MRPSQRKPNLTVKFLHKALQTIETKFLESLDFDFQRLYNHTLLKTLQVFWSHKNFVAGEHLNKLLFKQLMVELQMLNNSTCNSVLSRPRFDRNLHNCVKMMVISLCYSCLLGLQKSDLSEVHAAQMLITDLSDTVLSKGGRFVQFCDKLFNVLDPLHHNHMEEEEELVNLLIKPYRLQYLELCQAQKASNIQNTRKAELTYTGSEIIRKFWVNQEDEPVSPTQTTMNVITKLKNQTAVGKNGPLSRGDSIQISKDQSPKFGIMMRSTSSSTKDIKFSHHSADLLVTSVASNFIVSPRKKV